MFLRKAHGSKLNVFAPINDLSTLSRTGAESRHGALLPAQQGEVAVSGGQILGDEYSDHVVKVGMKQPVSIYVLLTIFFLQNRSGIILREGFVSHYYDMARRDIYNAT